MLTDNCHKIIQLLYLYNSGEISTTGKPFAVVADNV